jgi:DNA invertase Pin-like site-specific DNA recombinase
MQKAKIMDNARKPQIAYYRVSTVKQGKSGLGLEAQKNLVFGFLKEEPDYEFTDIETGSIDDRVELNKAIELSKELDGRLVIAKLDRLGRDVHFISGLIKKLLILFAQTIQTQIRLLFILGHL